MKLYIVSGLGADYKVLERLTFNPGIETVFLDWLIPAKNESFNDYVKRMAVRIDDSEPFYLLGYSFGGIIVQEINKLKPAEKVVILGSIKSDQEKSRLMKLGRYSRVPRFLPAGFYSEKSTIAYAFVRRLFDPKNPRLLEYFQVKHPYYLKWSIEKIVDWKFSGSDNVIQILGDRDMVFPIKNSKPDYVIKGGSHLFPATKHREVSSILKEIFINPQN